MGATFANGAFDPNSDIVVCGERGAGSPASAVVALVVFWDKVAAQSGGLDLSAASAAASIALQARSIPT